MYPTLSSPCLAEKWKEFLRVSHCLEIKVFNWPFLAFWLHSKVKVARFARNIVKCDFFLDFQIPWDFPVNGELEMQNREKALWLTSSSSRRHFWVRFTVCRSISRFGSESFLTSFIHPWNQSKKLEGRLNLIAFLSRDLEKSLVGISLKMMANLDVPREV